MAPLTRRLWTSNFRTALFGLATATVAAAPRFGVPLSAEQASDLLIIAGGGYACLFALFAADEANANGHDDTPPASQ